MNITPHPENAGHHSTGDWSFFKIADWGYDATWSLAGAYYVSPLFSLELGTTTHAVYALSVLAEAQDMKAGRLTSWVRTVLSGVGFVHFYIGVTAPGSVGIELNPNWQNYVFIRSRFTWWQGLDTLGAPATVVYKEGWVAEAWVDQGTTYHPVMTGLVNRVGVGCTPQSLGYRRAFDDTIIERWIDDSCN